MRDPHSNRALMIRGQLGIRADRQVYNHELVVLHMVRPDWYAGDLRTQVHLHRDGAVVLIPLPDQQMRITIVVPSGEASKWRKMTNEQLVAELTKRVPKLQSVPIQREGEHIYKMVRMHAEQYSRQGIALIGDAAHGDPGCGSAQRVVVPLFCWIDQLGEGI